MLRWKRDARTTAGSGTRTASSRAARCSRRSRSAPDICIPRALLALLRALLQLPLHVRRHFVRLRFTPQPIATSRALFTPYRTSWSSVSRLAAPESIAYVPRASRPYRAELRLRPEQRAVETPLHAYVLQQVAARDVQLAVARVKRSYVQQKLLAVLRLREETARATRHRNHLVACIPHTHGCYLDGSTRGQRE